MAIPYTLFARGLREIGAPEAGLIGLVEPILNPIWVVLFVHERPAGADRRSAGCSCSPAWPIATGPRG